MAATSTVVYRGDIGSLYLEIDKITGDASYPAGGYSIPSSVGIGTILAMGEGGVNTSGVGYFPEYNTTTGKLQVLWPAGSAQVMAEVTTGTVLTAVTFTMISIGY
jgi:hypothetical protein